MRVSELKDMAVVSVQEGTKLGRVEQPLIDLAAWNLGALKVKGDSGTFVLPFAEIQQIGTDAITVPNSQVMQLADTGGAAGSMLDLHALGKLKVVDQAGTFLGQVGNVEIDPLSGQLTQLTVHRGGVLRLGGTTTTIQRDAVAAVGSELLTVRTDSGRPAPDSDETTSRDEGSATSAS